MWDGTPVVPEKNPLAAYDAAFSGISAAMPVNAAQHKSLAVRAPAASVPP